MTIKEATIKVLELSQEPLDAQAITKRVLELNLWSTNGKTPANTVAAQLYMDIKKYGNAPAFCLASLGKFSLNQKNPETTPLEKEKNLLWLKPFNPIPSANVRSRSLMNKA